MCNTRLFLDKIQQRRAILGLPPRAPSAAGGPKAMDASEDGASAQQAEDISDDEDEDESDSDSDR